VNFRYLQISQVARDVAFLLHIKKGVSVKEIEEKFNKRYARKGLDELINQDPKLVIFDNKKGVYKTSEKLEAEIQVWTSYVNKLL